MNEKIFNVIGALAAVVAGAAAQRVLEKVWGAVVGDKPADLDDPDTGIGEALLWALLSGVVVTVVRQLATREVKRYYVESLTPEQRAEHRAKLDA